MRPDWRKVVIYASIIGIELCWLYALLALFNRRAAADALSVAGMLAIYPAALAFNSAMRRLGWHRFIIRAANYLGWAAAFLVSLKLQLYGGLAWGDTAWLMSVPRAFIQLIETFRPELLLLTGSIVIWWMGRRVAFVRPGFSTTMAEFQFGLVLLIIAFFSASMLDINIAHAVLLALGFFFVSLVGISTAHALETGSWLAGLYRGRWSGLLLLSIAIIIVAGFIISIIVTPGLLNALLTAVKWVFNLIVTVLVFIASLIDRIMPDFGEAEPPPFPTMVPPEETPSTEGSHILRDIFRIVWTVFVCGFLVFALWRISSQLYRWLRRRFSGTGGAEFKPVKGAFGADIRAFFKRLVGWVLGLRRIFRRRSLTGALTPEVATVRQLYRQFLRWAAAGGFPRQASQTPYEYAGSISGRLAAVRADLDLITRQYVRTRYGASPLTEEELQKLKQSWYNIRQSREAENRKKEKDAGGNARWII